MRLDKYLAACTALSRKEAKRAIHRGMVLVDGTVVKDEAIKVVQGQEVVFQGRRLEAKDHVYIMMNKPAGVLSATRDANGRTVVDLLEDTGRQVFPVGRLDKDTEGLLLLTDDGGLAHRLLSPVYHVPKTYYLEYEGTLPEDAVCRVKEGLEIGEKRRTKPGRLRLCGEGVAELTIAEGKFHQVKRMISALGGEVTYLKRVSMAGILLDESLAAGEYRELTEEECGCLRECAKKGDFYGEEKFLCGEKGKDAGNLPDVGGM